MGAWFRYIVQAFGVDILIQQYITTVSIQMRHIVNNKQAMSTCFDLVLIGGVKMITVKYHPCGRKRLQYFRCYLPIGWIRVRMREGHNLKPLIGKALIQGLIVANANKYDIAALSL